MVGRDTVQGEWTGAVPASTSPSRRQSRFPQIRAETGRGKGKGRVGGHSSSPLQGPGSGGSHARGQMRKEARGRIWQPGGGACPFLSNKSGDILEGGLVLWFPGESPHGPI